MERANLIQITLSRSLWLLWSVPFFPRRSAILVCVVLLFISISIFSLNVNIIGQRLSCFSLLAAYLYDWVGVSISSLVIEFFLFNSKLYLLIGFYVCPSLEEIGDNTFGLLLWGNLKDQTISSSDNRCHEWLWKRTILSVA